MAIVSRECADCRYYLSVLGRRSIISLCQLLAIQPRTQLLLLFEKCDVNYPNSDDYAETNTLQFLRDTLVQTQPEKVMDVVSEITRLAGSYRVNAPVKWRYQQHWDDLARCLMLDGYLIQGSYNSRYEIVAIDPTIHASAPIEDDLTSELDQSRLDAAEEVKRLLQNSAEDFRKQPPDFNGSLTSARVALEAIAKGIAVERRISKTAAFNPEKWGEVVAYLRTSGLISKREEEGLAGVYSFISEGAHNPVGMTEEEMVRLGRSLAAGMSYFLVKRYRG
jgi:hypothetical protein